MRNLTGIECNDPLNSPRDLGNKAKVLEEVEMILAILGSGPSRAQSDPYWAIKGVRSDMGVFGNGLEVCLGIFDEKFHKNPQGSSA